MAQARYLLGTSILKVSAAYARGFATQCLVKTQLTPPFTPQLHQSRDKSPSLPPATANFTRSYQGNSFFREIQTTQTERICKTARMMDWMSLCCSRRPSVAFLQRVHKTSSFPHTVGSLFSLHCSSVYLTFVSSVALVFSLLQFSIPIQTKHNLCSILCALEPST